MVRRIFPIIGLAVMLILAVGTGLVLAKEKPPTWTPVFQTNSVPGFPSGFAIFSVETFKDQIYMTLSSEDGPQIYRSSDGTTWSNVTPTGLLSNYVVSWDMQVFDGRLYVSVYDRGPIAYPGAILRTSNGKEWEKVFEGTMDSMQKNNADKFGVYNGEIYLTTVGKGGQIWRSRTGNSGSWVLTTPSLGENVSSTASPTLFKGDLYILGVSSKGMLVWRSHDGKNWETVGEGVLNVPSNSGEGGNLTVFNNQLYLSAQNYTEGGRIYRSRDGQHWDLLGNQDFTAHNISEIWATMVFKGHLYAFTNDTSSPGCTRDWSCAKILRSHSGNPGDWELLNEENGWGPSSATIRNTQAIFKGQLYTSNWTAWWGNGNGLYRLDK